MSTKKHVKTFLIFFNVVKYLLFYTNKIILKCNGYFIRGTPVVVNIKI